MYEYGANTQIRVNPQLPKEIEQPTKTKLTTNNYLVWFSISHDAVILWGNSWILLEGVEYSGNNNYTARVVPMKMKKTIRNRMCGTEFESDEENPRNNWIERKDDCLYCRYFFFNIIVTYVIRGAETELIGIREWIRISVVFVSDSSCTYQFTRKIIPKVIRPSLYSSIIRFVHHLSEIAAQKKTISKSEGLPRTILNGVTNCPFKPVAVLRP